MPCMDKIDGHIWEMYARMLPHKHQPCDTDDADNIEEKFRLHRPHLSYCQMSQKQNTMTLVLDLPQGIMKIYTNMQKYCFSVKAFKP